MFGFLLSRIKNPLHMTAIPKVTRVFEYLKALTQIRNPIPTQLGTYKWNLKLSDVPVHGCIDRAFQGQVNKVEGAGRLDESDSPDFVFRVKKPSLTNCPPPPIELKDWLAHSDYKNPVREPQIIPLRKEFDEDQNVLELRFDDDDKRVKAWDKWKEQWTLWAEKARQDLKAQEFFNKIYELHATIEKQPEQLELVLGDGILQYGSQGTVIHHPVLLKRCQIVFEPDIPSFSVVETAHPVELYTALFQMLPDVPAQTIHTCRQEAEEGGHHPLDFTSTQGFLRAVVARLSPWGSFDEDEVYSEKEAEEKPRIFRQPVLFLRSRSQGLVVAIDRILEELKTQADAGLEVPTSIQRIVGIDTSPLISDQETDAVSLASGNQDENVLFSKPANGEQLMIAQRLEQHGSVLVQGPPGTGKTHTIANLVGHLLAQGKSVLVTSDRAKALRVVREKVVEDLQPLCVSVLTSDAESQSQLESSVDAISDRLSASNPNQLEEEAAELEKQRKKLIEHIKQLRMELKGILESEYRDIVVDGKAYSPSDAARFVAQRAGERNWIPGPLPPSKPMPLSVSELKELYETNALVSADAERELSLSLPDPDKLLTPAEFSELIKTRANIVEQGQILVNYTLWSKVASPSLADELDQLMAELISEFSTLRNMQPWELVLIEAKRQGEQTAQTWHEFFNRIRKLGDDSVGIDRIVLDHDPVLAPDLSLEDQLQVITEIISHLQSGKKLGWKEKLLKKDWFTLIEKLRIRGKQPNPSLIEHFSALKAITEYEAEKQEVIRRWKILVTSNKGPDPDSFGDKPERVFPQYLEKMLHLFSWEEHTWKALLQKIEVTGFQWDAFLRDIPPNPTPVIGPLIRQCNAVLEHMPPQVGHYINSIRYDETQKQIDRLQDEIQKVIDSNPNKAKVTLSLASAVSSVNPLEYEEAYEQLQRLFYSNKALARRRELLKKLEVSCPDWARAIANRIKPHKESSLPGDPVSAWLWRQLTEELDRRHGGDIEALSRKIDKANDDLFKITTRLIDCKAWAAQCRRTGLKQQQALQGWRQVVKRIGKGTGKRAELFRMEARKLMAECRTAVPVWIMPLNRVVENFTPTGQPFDVVIIDEASQMDVMGLISLYMAKQVIVVGDDKQVSPDAVGQQVDSVQHLINEWLYDIPNGNLYDGKTSIYDLAVQSFGGTIMLKEHFRCAPEIIQFSNALSYDGQIKPLRDDSSINLKPHWIPYRVTDAFSENKVNKKEAETIAALVVSATEQPEYKNASFGVISLVGEEQALTVQKLLTKYLSPDEFHRRRILCGNPANFQGDERDVIFLSVVDGPANGPLTKREFGTNDMYRKRYNVAVSRAKDQVWVAYSLQPDVDLKPGDIRRRLIEHALNPTALCRMIEQEETHTESEFERLVLRQLMNAGYKVIPQWKVGAYRIDLVVEGGGKRLAVECDGDRFHLDKIDEDMARQAILERLGWQFARIRGSQYFRNPEAAMKPVFEKLQAIGVTPDLEFQTPEEPLGTTELQDRVSRRAEELLREWSEEGISSEAVTYEKSPAETVVTVPRTVEPAPTPTSKPASKDITPLRETTLPAVVTLVKPEKPPVDISQATTVKEVILAVLKVRPYYTAKQEDLFENVCQHLKLTTDKIARDKFEAALKQLARKTIIQIFHQDGVCVRLILKRYREEYEN